MSHVLEKAHPPTPQERGTLGLHMTSSMNERAPQPHTDFTSVTSQDFFPQERSNITVCINEHAVQASTNVYNCD